MASARRLDEAMREIRGICNGLVLPQIETAAVADVLRLAVDEHERRTGTSVALGLPIAARTRCVREDQHLPLRAGGAEQRLSARAGKEQASEPRMKGGRLFVEVFDGGPGFDPAKAEGLGLPACGSGSRALAGSSKL